MFRVEIAIAKVIGVTFPHFNGNILYIYIYIYMHIYNVWEGGILVSGVGE